MDRILIIENNKSVSQQIQQTLEQGDFKAVLCINYNEAAMEIMKGEYFAAIVDMDPGNENWQSTISLISSRAIPVILFSDREYTAELRETLQKKNILEFISKNRKQSYDDLFYAVRRMELNREIKVLIVDDSPSARKISRYILERTKFSVMEAGDGMEALGLIESNPDIRIVICDFEMPHMNGYELVKILREQYNKERLSIIGLSHPSTKASSATFLKSGANDFISKPYSPEEFYCRIITQAELLEAFTKVNNLNEQKNNLIGMVAHDIRVPLANIEMICNRLLEKSRDDLTDHISKALTVISRASGKMMSFLNDLLNITSLEKGQGKLVLRENSLSELVEERLESIFFVSAEKKGISLKMKSEELPAVSFDRDRISQVIDNLISNAVKFTQPGGEIIINLKNKKGRVVFRVWDNGPGMSRYDKEHAFLEFQKLSAKPTGGETSTGLGLAICRKIVLMHKGRIWVESEPGQGAEFCFSLPLEQ
ncbi:hybrid sensor histidine kinase/response regulator [Spirochaeta isovalerica]|uniref:histidine kinase n=1 Tax=Spirochaeta isovalerica TaxID=150 RepID=A0A841RCQ9_9SPIO|nr:hybrid sensor histidine kinase/response regulator [Spirochaeta isovalerica]MBB6481785.1 signal transduction histidine kinase [Spirochaeta isovalerica]